MSKSMVVFGAGPGLGRSAAWRFGREGFRVALVARNRKRLDDLVAELAAEGLEAAGYPADIADRAGLDGLVTKIEAVVGDIDVLHVNATAAAAHIATPLRVDSDNLQAQLDVLLHTPVTLVQRLLPGMLARRDGGLLVSLGASAVNPMPVLANVGIAMAGLYNYVHTLHAELADTGVYAGVLTVGALVRNSDVERMHDAQSTRRPDRPAPEKVDPDLLADYLWEMYTARDRIARAVGSFAQSRP
jgi:NAD(P)-dependent dehydrogenase (short-subunit alcohol dehydrogenase family)